MPDKHAQKVKEAQELRDLGFYTRALDSYREAEEEKGSFMLAAEISATMIEQGCFKSGFEKINAAIEMFSDGMEDKVELALVQMMRECAKANITGQFSSALAAATRLYNDHLLHRPVEDYEKRLVAMQLIYLNSRGLASMVGVEVAGPGPDQEFLEQLFYYLLRNSRFAEALRVAKSHSSRAEPSRKTELITILLQEKQVSDLVRAEALYEHAELLWEADQTKQSDVQLDDARNLYKKVGHGYGTLMVEVQRCAREISKTPNTQIMERLYQIKEQLESIGYWDGSRQTIKVLYEIAQGTSDVELKNALDHELLRLRDILGSPLYWVSQQLVTLGKWDFSGANAAKMLSSLEALYETTSAMEAPRLRTSLAQMLYTKFKSLGETSKAAEWASKCVGGFPDRMGFMYGTDKFYRELEEETKPVDENIESERLRAELARVAEDISAETTPIGQRHLGVQKISNMCNLYLDQFRLRGLDRTKHLVEICLEVAESRLEYLSAAPSKFWKANLLEVRARIAFTEACTGEVPNLDKLRASLALYKQALAAYKSAGSLFQMAMTQGQIGTCYRTLWAFEGAAPDSEYFESAVSSHESATACLARVSTMLSARKMQAGILLNIWFAGYSKSVKFYRPRILLKYLTFPRWSRITQWMRSLGWMGIKSTAFFRWLGYRTVSPSDEVLKWLDVVEKLADEERHDLSALESKQAVLAKQGLRRENDIRALYDIAINLHMMLEDGKGLWNWIQKSKARSLSDMLGLGINLPENLKKRVDEDPKARAMLEHEIELLQKINQDTSDTQFYLRKELDAHRRAMHGVESLHEILALREGRAVSQARLQSLRRHDMTEEAERRIFYVDWFICQNKIYALVVSDESDDVGFFDPQMTTMDVAEWKKAHLSTTKPLNDEDPAPLRAITRLVEPLLNVTKEGDLLVLCPTDVLHGIPLHAAIISPEESLEPQFLIDRNPIVYTSSLTIFEQCVLRAASTSERDGRHTETFLAVYEESNDIGWEREREKIYKTSSKLASQSNGAVALGSEVTRSRFEAACESDAVHFFGHFKREGENIMDQGLILVADSNIPSTENSGVVSQAEETDNEEPQPDTFSVSDMFSTSIKTSHFTLIACASATQTIQQGDEPLGIVTALLCAGASSVVGTMWPIASGAGRAFLKHFSNNLRTSVEGESIVDLAVALQKTVKKLKTGPKAMKEPYYWSSFVLHGAWFYRRS